MKELVVDSFAGGGGASEGIAAALGRGPDVAINHNPDAIRMHAANHPETRHFVEDVFKITPRVVTGGKPVGLLWASPDCRHFSRAKGGKPVEKRIRGLAWAVVKWAVEARPRVIILENVREFEDWGPLIPRWECTDCEWKGTEGQAKLARRGKRACPRCDSRKLREAKCKKTGQPMMVPDPARKGLSFRRWVGRLRNLGYVIAYKILNAADYGAPTHRRRLFLVARRDGRPIVWPEPSHGDPKKIADAAGGLFGGSDLLPWRTAAECIDWSIECPSIFDRKKPLVEKTLRRIASGVKRYVLDNPKPFIVGVGGRAGQTPPTSADAPIGTITAKNDRAVISPVIARLGQTGGNGLYANTPAQPLTTVTAKAEHMVVAPLFVHRYTELPGRQSRGSAVDEPAAPITATANGSTLIAPTLMRHFGKSSNAEVDEPLGTVVAGGHGKTNLVAAVLSQYHGQKGDESRCGLPSNPINTLDTQPRYALVSAFVAKHFGGMVGVPADTPLPTTTARGTQNQIVAANLVHLNHGQKTSSAAGEPARTVTAGGNHAAVVYSFLTKYFGTAVGAELAGPLHTSTGKDRFGLVTVTIAGEPYVLVDIGMRMLRPRELARAQGFPESYKLTGTATDQVARIGNSVCPPVAEAMVRANYGTKSKAATA